MKAHKHATLIKAWADGAEIQFKNRLGVWEDGLCIGSGLPTTPMWYDDAEYRIKPQPNPHQWCIDAHKAGAEIQWRYNDSNVWLDCRNPIWSRDCQYRVKPYPDVVMTSRAQVWTAEGKPPPGAAYNPQSGQNLRLTFNSFTGKLRSAEVI